MDKGMALPGGEALFPETELAAAVFRHLDRSRNQVWRDAE
jgi:hypothetical protein